jgi:nitroimidazol reductase NimA-like FMN-containing flavoprotein (pyridoxamine 5'-phosphate oxidase superfamily)
VRVDLESKDVEAFLSAGKPKLLRLAVVSPGKPPAPHLSSVWYLWKGGRFWITTSEDRLKVAAIRKNNRVAVIIDTDVMPYKGVIVEGTATLTRRKVKEITLAIAEKYVAKKNVREEFEDLMKYPRVLICIRPLKAIDIMSYETR